MPGARRRALLCAAAAVAIAGGPRGAEALGRELPDCERVALEFANTCANDDGTGSYQDPLADPLATADASCTADNMVCPDGIAAGCAAQFVALAFCRRTLHAARSSLAACSLADLAQLYLTRARAGTAPGSARGAGTSASRVATMGAS